MDYKSITLKVIGRVSRGMSIEGKEFWDRWSEVSVIELEKDYEKALRGIEEYSHIFVIYWMDRVVGGDLEGLLISPRWAPSIKVGVLATRLPRRINPIGLTVCELVSVKGNTLEVRGLDAFTGTPVLDLKPYDYYDVVKAPRVPPWFVEKWIACEGNRPAWLGPQTTNAT